MIDLAPNPEAYAARLARYITDPSTIRARTMDFWGRAPSLKKCEALRDKYAEKRKAGERREIANLHTGNFKCGHTRAKENTYLTETGTLVCKTCRRATVREASRRRREKMIAKLERERLSREAAERLAQIRRVELERAAQQAMLNGFFIDELIGKVAHIFSLTYADIIGEQRTRRFVLARAVVVKLLRDRGISYPNIARRMNRKCHSSVKYLSDKFADFARNYPIVANAYEALR